ncbi:hypothetical protein TWF696_004614 [Orbilia brochopaga]|uniref:Uncharacterized protein n=1 Tax=Orbilia brochopaga TaxID=3140254 RepID=A0AAV9V7E7_9PEZI
MKVSRLARTNIQRKRELVAPPRGGRRSSISGLQTRFARYISISVVPANVHCSLPNCWRLAIFPNHGYILWGSGFPAICYTIAFLEHRSSCGCGHDVSIASLPRFVFSSSSLSIIIIYHTRQSPTTVEPTVAAITPSNSKYLGNYTGFLRSLVLHNPADRTAFLAC